MRQAIASIPVEVADSSWVEIGRGHTKKCRLYWVQIIPTIASESTPQQFAILRPQQVAGHPDAKPQALHHRAARGDDVVTVQYQWQVGNEEPCCPKGIGTVKFQIGPDGKLQALGKIPHQ